MSQTQEVLRLEKINKSFPGVKALSDVDFSLQKGEVHALMGENGAGKSTLMKILSGAYKRDSGNIYINGERVEILNPKHSQMLGIAIIYQELNLIKRVTVAENIFLGRYPRKAGVIQWKQMFADAQALFDSFDIDLDASAGLSSLSLAQQQLVEIIKAVSIDAKVVIMDEPTSSLTTRETEVLFRIIEALKARGIAVVFITHRLDEVFTICDRISVLRDGCYIGTRNIKDITKSEMIAMMIGRELNQQYPAHTATIGEEVLRVENLSDGHKYVKGVSFQARAGEILGFAGLVGAGRTETMRLIFGVDKKSGGKIFIDGKEVQIKSPVDAIANGIGFVTENRKEEGLLLNQSVQVNNSLVAYKRILRMNFCFDFKRERQFAEEYIQALRIATPSPRQKVMYLSGGNQQKVVLSKWLMNDPRIIIFDEPTRGIDVGAKREIYEIINELATKGNVIIVVSSDLEEIMGISDRILVMHEGVISGEVQREDFSQHLITEYAVGGR